MKNFMTAGRWVAAWVWAVLACMAHGQALEPGMDRLGSDYRRIELPVADPVMCQSHCVGDAQCKSFTYVKPGVQAPAAVCYLKSSAPAPVPNNCCVSGLRPEVTQAQAESVLYRALQAWQASQHTRVATDGVSDTLAEYAAKCDAATGIHVPVFSCNDGVEVPGQGNGSGLCDHPNVLNGRCDPGSKFQVLPGRSADAAAVAHCRRVGLPADGSTFNDIAVIQHNKKNGATCFYQALNNLPGQNIPAPIGGEAAPWADGVGHWISPRGTEAIGCTGCHDSGGFIRSNYLAQLKTPPHALPSNATGFDNATTPLRYVGRDYATNRSWSITTSNAANDPGPSCTACHRLAVPNRQAFGMINGTAAHFANIATAATQASKNPHSATSPIWMRPGQVVYNSGAEATATKFHNCAVGFFNSGFTTAPAGCTITPLGMPWAPDPPPNDNPVACSVFNDGASNASGLSQAISFAGPEAACVPDGTSRGTCRRWFGNCVSTRDNVAVTFKVFNDGGTSPTAGSGAVLNRAPEVSCIPDGTSTGTCRRWFGLGATANRREVSCYLFDDGLSNWIGPTQAIYYRGPGQVCMPDGTGTGTGACRKWFGNCQVGAPLPPQPQPPGTMSTSVAPTPIALNRPVRVTVTARDAATNAALAGQVRINGSVVGSTNTPFTFTFRTRRVRIGGQWETVFPAGTVTVPGYQNALIDFGFD